MNLLRIKLPTLCVIGVSVFSLLSAGVDYFENSNMWPPKVQLCESIKLDNRGKRLPAGRQGVLIRVQMNDSGKNELVVDFGSEGVKLLQIEQTDFVERVEKYKNGESTKSHPNWTMMIGRGFLRVEEDGLRPIKLNEILDYKYMLIIYAEELEALELTSFLASLDASQEAIDELSVLVLLFPVNQEHRVEGEAPIRLREQCSFDFYYLYPYLSQSFLASLHHEIEDLRKPIAVLVDVEGKTIASSKPLNLSSQKFEADLILDSLFQALTLAN